MKTKNVRSLMIVALLSAFTALPLAAHGALVSNPGSISSGGGVIGGGNWTTGVSLGWSVADAGGDYLYSYTFQAPSQGSGLSHFILQTSDNFTSSNITEISNRYELGTFSAAEGNSNPEMPGPLFGIKFEGIEGGAPWTLTLTSDRAPMDGDFYAKGGVDSYAYNSGFGERDGAKILVPDTVPRVLSEPGVMTLLGIGLLSIAVFERRRRRMQNHFPQ